MKRINEKVKDLIEVHSYKSLHDFISDPSQTLSAYYFTDVTADLMAKWLDKIVNVQFQNGGACALAGYRGVGKSHFLATLGAILSHLELRSRVTDSHVSTSAQRLKRTRYAVGYVRRGTHPTLLAELKDGIAKAFELNVADLSDSVGDLLNLAAQKSGEPPFILMFDTAFERTSHVVRDDGVLLGEIAEIAKSLNIFVAVALDDDIAGADGINAAIARNFTIDYLDQEHLYRIVNTHIFPKQRQMTSLLHDIYTNFREIMPNFRWSEQRFSSLYPLHPIILEIAPFVRLYAPDFALLGFAADAGGKILGRPANSLIALDEVFDTIENTLRKIEDLKEAFSNYDKINTRIISQIPVMQRLQAKLVLKALFLLSLEGEGTTASEIGAAMLIYDENEPAKAVRNVSGLLENFVSAFPEDIQCVREEGREVRYRLKIGAEDNLTNLLSEAIKTVSPTVIPKIIRRTARERFSDWTFSEDTEANSWIDCQINWRGCLRRGRIYWGMENNVAEPRTTTANSEFLDWEVVIGSEIPEVNTENSSTDISRVYWQPAALRKDETETILRYYVLLTNNDLREEYGEQIRAAGHALTLSVEKIWNRIFVDDAKIIIDGFNYPFSDDAKSAQTLSELFSLTLEPLFEARYPNHPYFSQTIGMTEVSTLINDFFSGARQTLSEVQQLAKKFALPLGLVAQKGEIFVLETEEKLVKLPLVEEIMSLVKVNREKPVSLKTVYRQLKQSPNGLVREAQHLILAALVAQRQIEFVTSKNDRINRRSLDLTIIWDDIIGIAKPSTVLYGNERLTAWVRILTGADFFQSIEVPEESEAVRKSLEGWLKDWDKARILERFDDLSSEILNTKIWRIWIHTCKTFGTVAETIRTILDRSISLEEGLQRVADAFSDSEQEYFICTKDLVVLEDFISGVKIREKVWAYLAVCEITKDEKTEYFREKLLDFVDESYAKPNEILNREMDNLWQTFHTRFSEHFAIKHDMIMKSHHLQEQFDEILQSDEWWEFENLSRQAVFRQDYRQEAKKIRHQFKELDCRFDVREMLKTHPFCACSFNLAKIREWEKLPATFRNIIKQGRTSYLTTLRKLAKTLIPYIEQFSAKNNEREFADAALHLIEILENRQEIQFLTNNELIILQKVFESMPSISSVEIDFANTENFINQPDFSFQTF